MNTWSLNDKFFDNHTEKTPIDKYIDFLKKTYDQTFDWYFCSGWFLIIQFATS